VEKSERKVTENGANTMMSGEVFQVKCKICERSCVEVTCEKCIKGGMIESRKYKKERHGKLENKVKLSTVDAVEAFGGLMWVFALDLGSRWSEWSASRPGRVLTTRIGGCGSWVGTRLFLEA
jgi:hypothetical protein